MKRHVGRMANTDQRVVVVFMQIPDKEDHALVVSTESLPPRWEHSLMQVLNSPEGQSDPDLGNVLGRRLMPDSTDTMLMALHNAGLLHRVPVANVVMYPEPSKAYSLKSILQAMGRLSPDEYAAVDKLNEKAEAPKPSKLPTTTVDPYVDPVKFNPHSTNQAADAANEQVGVANGLLMEANMLEQEAAAKRERAYIYAPSLRPASSARPVVEQLQKAKPVRRPAQTRVKATKN